MKKEIETRDEIHFIISTFYNKMIDDVEMYPFFEKFVVHNTLEKHLETITNFWQDILFDTTLYRENVLKKHMYTNAFIKFGKVHFERWLKYFKETIDEFFIGLKADMMKNRAVSIATVMQLKMNLH